MKDVFGFGLVLWHINHCRLFNGKSSLFIYTRYKICKHKSTKLNAMYHKHQSFAYTELNDQTVLFKTIQFSIG